MSKIDNNILKSFKEFLITEKAKDWQKEREIRKKLISEAFSKENIDSLEKDKFEEIIKMLWASQFWGKKDYLIEKINQNGFINIKKAFKHLFYGSESLEDRFDFFRSSIKHIGPSMLTEIMAFNDPNQYCIWNDKPKNVLPFLNYQNELPDKVFKQQIEGNDYTLCINVLEKVKNQLTELFEHPDFINTDLFLAYIFYNILSKEEVKKEEKTEEIKGKGAKEEEVGIIYSHSDAQGVLLEIGKLLAYDTYVAKEDRNKTFNDKTLEEIAILNDIPTFSYERILETAKYIDVIWFHDGFPVYCFEVEESTDITKGLNRLADLEGFKVLMFIVGGKEKRKKFNKEINRFSFRNIKDQTKFLDYSKLEKFYKITKQFTNLKEEILE